jgi:hypothetical protein
MNSNSARILFANLSSNNHLRYVIAKEMLRNKLPIANELKIIGLVKIP